MSTLMATHTQDMLTKARNTCEVSWAVRGLRGDLRAPRQGRSSTLQVSRGHHSTGARLLATVLLLP